MALGVALECSMFSRLIFYCLMALYLSSCGDQEHFEGIFTESAALSQGDIIVISGGTVASNTTPFPLHKASLFNSSGVFKRFLYEAPTSSFLYGGSIDQITGDFLVGVENIDRVDKIDPVTYEQTSFIIDPNLSGITIRSVESLSDGSVLIAESPTVIEKYSANGVRSGAPFPLTLPTSINSLKRISGGRWIVTFTTNPDSPRIYSNAGVLLSTFPITSPCTNNCDPYDVVELADGRFVVNSRVTNALYLYSSNLTYVGVLYLNTNILQGPSSMAKLSDNNILVCNTTFNTCEKLLITGNTATRVGNRAFIDNVSVMRQPTALMVVE